jgi:hypothetical protein
MNKLLKQQTESMSNAEFNKYFPKKSIKSNNNKNLANALRNIEYNEYADIVVKNKNHQQININNGYVNIVPKHEMKKQVKRNIKFAAQLHNLPQNIGNKIKNNTSTLLSQNGTKYTTPKVATNTSDNFALAKKLNKKNSPEVARIFATNTSDNFALAKKLNKKNSPEVARILAIHNSKLKDKSGKQFPKIIANSTMQLTEIQTRMSRIIPKNKHLKYEVHDAGGGGDCLFLSIIAALKNNRNQLKCSISKSDLSVNYLRTLLTTNNKQYPIEEYRKHVLQLKNINGHNINTSFIKHNSLHASSLNNFKKYIKSSNYWANEWAISKVEWLLNIKLIIYNQEIKKDVQYISCNDNEHVPNPDYYVLIYKTTSHYQYVTYDTRSMFTQCKLPLHLLYIIKKYNNAPVNTPNINVSTSTMVNANIKPNGNKNVNIKPNGNNRTPKQYVTVDNHKLDVIGIPDSGDCMFISLIRSISSNHLIKKVILNNMNSSVITVDYLRDYLSKMSDDNLKKIIINNLMTTNVSHLQSTFNNSNLATIKQHISIPQIKQYIKSTSYYPTSEALEYILAYLKISALIYSPIHNTWSYTPYYGFSRNAKTLQNDKEYIVMMYNDNGNHYDLIRYDNKYIHSRDNLLKIDTFRIALDAHNSIIF